jgi:hypothetical protein
MSKLSETANHIASLREVKDGVERMEGVTALQLAAARRLLVVQNLPETAENVLRMTQIIATNRSRPDS